MAGLATRIADMQKNKMSWEFFAAAPNLSFNACADFPCGRAKDPGQNQASS
jgi:hypothetical protein